MKVYLVGGAVRDGVLGREVHDRDYVVVGATHEEMIDKGFTQVGASFPVYLHPETKEEYALARTERKTGKGHTGFETFFSPDVTLEEDLSRRDLTINAMAQDLDTGFIIDPFGGMTDICNKVLRHTTKAFLDDPLRILRAYRLKSQLGKEWDLHPETKEMCFQNRHELTNISGERKWKEVEKALGSDNFRSYAEAMAELGELPELNALRGVEQPVEHHPEGDAFIHTLLCLDIADQYEANPYTKFAVLCHDFGKAVTFAEYGNLIGHEEAGLGPIDALCERIRVPNDFRDVAKYVAENHTRVHCIAPRGGNKGAKPRSLMKLFEAAGNVNSAKTRMKVGALADACFCDAKGRGPSRENEPYPQGYIFMNAYRCMLAVDTKAISADGLKKGKAGIEIGEMIRVARIDAIRNLMRQPVQW
uniref:tRNA nucleotidyltransferase n=1 Tax=Salmonella phage vB_SEnST11_KE22 TaxID=3161173 RepID=A0AAU8GES0_9CAUD